MGRKDLVVPQAWWKWIAVVVGIVAAVLNCGHSQGVREGPGNFDCALLVKGKSREWNAVDEAVKSANGFLQSLIDCVPEGDVLLFDTESLNFNETVNLRRPIKIGSGLPEKNTTVPRVEATCPLGQAVFSIRSSGVTVSGFSFRGCNLNNAAILQIHPGSNVTMENSVFAQNTNTNGPACITALNATLTLRNSSFLSNTGVEGGVANMAGNSSLHVFGVHFTDNSAVNGGSILSDNSSVNVIASIFRNNSAAGMGGAIHMEVRGGKVHLNIENSEFSANRISGPLTLNPTPRSGGAISVVGGDIRCSINQSRFWENSAIGYGGALLFRDASDLVIANTSFTGNTAFQGGAVDIEKMTEIIPVATIAQFTGVVFEDNWVEGDFEGDLSAGGALVSANALSLVLESCQFLNNSAAKHGGALTCSNTQSVSMNASLFVGNSAGVNGGGVFGAGVMATPSIWNLTNVSFESNVASNFGGAAHFVGHNLKVIAADTVFDSNSASEGGAVTILIGAEVFVSQSKFTNNGGGQTLRAGAVFAAKNGSRFDVRDSLFGQNVAKRAGALQVLGPDAFGSFVDSVFTNNTAPVSAGAIDMWNGSNVVIHKCLFDGNKVALDGGAVSLNTALFTSSVIVTASIFEGNTAGRYGAAVFLDGDHMSSLMDGNTVFLHNIAGLGGAVFASALTVGSTVGLSNVVFDGNLAASDFGTGGAVQFSGQGLNVVAFNTTFTNNSAVLGGAAGIDFGAHVLINQSFFLHNSAGRDEKTTKEPTTVTDAPDILGKEGLLHNNGATGGGGIFVYGPNTTLSIFATKFLGNMAGSGGGAVQGFFGANVNIQSSLFIGNTAVGQGGAVRFDENGSRLHAEDLTFENNTAEDCGGLLVSGPDAFCRVLHSTFQGNTAQNGGGALCAVNGTTMSVEKSTFRDNQALSVGAGAVWMASGQLVTNLTVAESLFEGNGSPDGLGGAMLVEGDKANCVISGGNNFTNNKAFKEGGAIFANVITGAMNLTVEKSVFVGNKAESFHGGAVATVGEVTTAMKDTDFDNNMAAIGGAIHFFERGRVYMSTCTFTRNQAALFGGAVYFEHKDLNTRPFQGPENMIVFIDQTVFTDNSVGSALVFPNNNSTFHPGRGRGGGIATVGAGTEISLKNSIIKSNRAALGGGVYWEEGDTLKIRNVTVSGNEAIQGGGMHAESSDPITVVISLSRVTFSGNRAQKGGGLSMSVLGDAFQSMATILYEQGRVANLTRVRFLNNLASDQGGGVYFQEMLLKCVMCTFEFNEAGGEGQQTVSGSEGGALFVGLNAIAELKGCAVKGNSGDRGGGVFVENGGLNCNAVKFVNNVARDVGGAVGMQYGSMVTTASGVLMNCTACTVKGNEARLGGGFYIFVEKSSIALQQCIDATGLQDSKQDTLVMPPICSGLPLSPDLLENRHILLRDLVVSDNTARASGAVIFTSDTSLVEVCCANQCLSAGNGFTHSLCKVEDGLAWKNNRITGDGEESVIASLVSRVELDPKAIIDHASGTPLKTIKVTLQDSLGQVVSGQNVSVVVRSDKPETLSGNPVIGVLLRDGRSNLSGINIRGNAGQYMLEFAFTLDSHGSSHTITKKLPVSVRECRIGEVFEASSLSCLHCEPESFAFNPDISSCVPCPEHAKCNGSTLVPLDGYWHATSRSVNVAECLIEEACTFTGRFAKLETKAFLAHFKDDVLDWVEPDYRQCAEGYMGPLCGSCDHTHGRKGRLECGKCPEKAVSITLLAVGLLIQFAVTAYFTNDALKHADKLRSPTEDSISQESPPHSDHVTTTEPVTWSTPHVMALATGYASEIQRDGDGSEEQMHVSLGHADDEIQEEAANDGDNSNVAGASGRRRGGNGTDCSPGPAERLVPNRWLEVLKILWNFLQVIGVAAAINAHWTDSVSYVLATSDYVSGVSSGSDIFSAECSFKVLRVPRSIQSFLFQTLSPCLIFVTFATFWIAKRLMGKLETPKLCQHVTVALLVVFYVSYIGITERVVRLFNCLEIDVSRRYAESSVYSWAEDTSMQCYKNSHAVVLATVGLPLAFFVVLGYPAGLTIKLFASRGHLEDIDFASTYGFLYKAYKEKAIFWEAVVLMRKGLLATIVVFSKPLGADQQATLAVIVLLASLVLHIQVFPYDDSISELNAMESWSLTASIFVFLCGLLFWQHRDDYRPQVALSCFVILVVVGFVVYLCWDLGRSSPDFIEGWLEERGLPRRAYWHNVYEIVLYLPKKGWKKGQVCFQKAKSGFRSLQNLLRPASGNDNRGPLFSDG